MRFNSKVLNQLPKDRYNIEFKVPSKRDILNTYDPFVAISPDDLTPFELENILNEDIEPGAIKFRNNTNPNLGVLNDNNSNKIKNNINLPAVN